ncbi:hypothetical protein PLIIFM63780_009761 [Purpureocillium lilacinum]|nr:hypothetical protein PLIIFM63780_009761 [Purpureocillium lilacinum]
MDRVKIQPAGSSSAGAMNSDNNNNAVHTMHPTTSNMSDLGPSKTLDTLDQAVRDANDLAALGHAQSLSRKFSIWSMLALAFCVLGTWSTMAQGLTNGLTNGGPVAILWGLCLVTFCNTCVAVSLGELCSSMPTALGQAYWISQLWNTPTGRFASYMCAWINTFGWWTLTASQIAFMTDFLLAMKVMFDEDWEGASKGWLQFIVYIAMTAVFTLFNHLACRKDAILPVFNKFVGVWFVALFFAFGLALPISVGTKSELSFQKASFVFGKWLNQTGWSDGVTWFLGLVQGAYGLTAFDSVIHMVEEIPAPRRNAPRTMYLAVLFGALSGFLFMIVCLFCIQDIDKLMDSPTGIPFIEITQSTVGLTGAGVLIGLFVFNGIGQGISVLTSSSRLTWSFARDGGIPFGAYFAHVDPVWKVPGRALWLQAGIIALVGVLYLFANTVLQAILSVSTIALTVSYAMPILTLALVGRDKLPRGEFSLGSFGPTVNWISIVYCVITTIFFFFPTTPSPAASDMNYAIAVFGVMMVVSIGFWFIQGRKTFMEINEMAEHILYAQNAEGEVSTEGDTVVVPQGGDKKMAP